jgi:hypothetical protein
MILAEGLLCRGLDDDPEALDAAAVLLRNVAAEEPANFFAQLELADALRKRFPLSDEAWSAARHALEMLGRADVGAARPDLTGYLTENLAAMDAQRRQAAPALARHAAGLAAGTLSPAEIREYLNLLVLTGPEGLTRAAAAVDAYLARQCDDALATLYRGEIARGRASRSESRSLYAAAQARLCRSDATAVEAAECELARWRLQQLERTVDRDGWRAARALAAAERRELR